jgi:glycogen operon protein
VKNGQPDWGPDSHSLALSGELRDEGLSYFLILNAYWEPLDFELPPVGNPGEAWHRWIDTALDAPNDIVEWQTAPPVPAQTYHAGERSVVMLVGGTRFESRDDL